MKDKEIIINNVDVSKCEYRNWRNFCHCDNSKENEGEKRVTGRGGCEYNSDCYFKQLKRKEQVLDEIEKQAKALSNRIPLFEIEQIAKDIIKIKNIINKAKDK